jgi:hypothetical protein
MITVIFQNVFFLKYIKRIYFLKNYFLHQHIKIIQKHQKILI